MRTNSVFYKLPPNSTIGPARLRGRKKRKERVTFLACCNASGTERLPLFVVGRAQHPRCFNGRNVAGEGYEYQSSVRAWMNRDLFFQWLLRFDRYFGEKNGRRVALIFDNASCHGNRDNLPEMQNVEVIYLSPRTTSRIQPLGAGVIACIKRGYHRSQLERAVRLIDSREVNNTYSLDLYTAMTLT